MEKLFPMVESCFPWVILDLSTSLGSSFLRWCELWWWMTRFIEFLGLNLVLHRTMIHSIVVWCVCFSASYDVFDRSTMGAEICFFLKMLYRSTMASIVIRCESWFSSIFAHFSSFLCNFFYSFLLLLQVTSFLRHFALIWLLNYWN
jgi:hypothetical protein